MNLATSAPAPDPFGTPQGPIPLAEFRVRILELYKPPLRALSSYYSMRRTLDLIAALGTVETTADLTTTTVARFVASRAGKESPNTTRTNLRKFSAACGIAHAEGWIRVNPFQVRKSWIRCVTPKAPRVHSREELGRVLSLAVEDIRTARGNARWKARRLYALFATALYTGMRKSEVLMLRVEDVDLARRCINLTARVEYQLKTPDAAQPVPMPAALASILRGWIGHVGACPHLFPNAVGEPWTGGPVGYTPTECLKQLGGRAGVPGLTFQSLRHSWATHAEYFGLTEAQIQRVLRHTNTKTQLRYRHAELENMRHMVARIDFSGPAAAEGPPASDVVAPRTGPVEAPQPPAASQGRGAPAGGPPAPIAADPSMVEYRAIPGFPRHRIGSDRSVWTNLHRSGKERPGDPPSPWRRLREIWRPGMTVNAAVVNLRRDGRTAQRTIASLMRDVFGPTDGESITPWNGGPDGPVVDGW